jgi:NAD(P)H-dependent flavin oxidoreductase YrpB (nitropropane dioxygenase family)
MIQTKFTELTGCKVPIQLAGMPGVNTVELASTVSNAGGLGMISATHMDTEFLTQTIDKVKKQTSLSYGVNFLVPFIDRKCIEVAASKSHLVEFFYGDPDPSLVDLVHSQSTLACWQIGSNEEAKLAEKAGCDLIVAQGVQAGGHVRGDEDLHSLLGKVLENVDIPVIAAGRIATAHDVKEVLKSGASAVRIGTRFVAAKESGAHPIYIQSIIDAGKDDTVLTETFSVGWSHAHHRVLKSCVDEVNSFQGDVIGERDLAGVKSSVPKGSIALPTKETTGHIEAMALYASGSAEFVKEIKSAAEIISELIECISYELRY